MNCRKLLQFFLNFRATFGNIWSGAVFQNTCRPSWKFSTQVFCKVNLQASASVKKDLHSCRYLRNFFEFQKRARMESVVFGMQFAKKELYYRLQSSRFRKLFGINIANCRFLEISRRTTLWNTPVQVIRFLTELYNVEISPITLLKNDSSREALLAILRNRKTHRKYFR